MGPGINAASDIGYAFEASALHQKHGHAHAARAVVAQAGNGALRIELIEARGDLAHGNALQLKLVAGGHAGDLAFPLFTHV